MKQRSIAFQCQQVCAYFLTARNLNGQLTYPGIQYGSFGERHGFNTPYLLFQFSLERCQWSTKCISNFDAVLITQSLLSGEGHLLAGNKCSQQQADGDGKLNRHQHSYETLLASSAIERAIFTERQSGQFPADVPCRYDGHQQNKNEQPW